MQRPLRICVPIAAALLTGCNGHWFKQDAAVQQTGPARTVTASEDPRVADAKDAPPPPISAAARIAAGRMLEADGNIPGAIEQYRKALNEEPQNVTVLSHLGTVLNRAGQFAEAESVLTRVVELEPRRAAAHNNLGFCRLLQGRHVDAETCFRRALELRPDFGRARMNLATVMVQSGRESEAIAEFQRVVPPDQAYYNVGLLLAGERKQAEAERAFRKCLELNPGNPQAVLQLARLTRGPGAEPSAIRATITDPADSNPPAANAIPTASASAHASGAAGGP